MISFPSIQYIIGSIIMLICVFYIALENDTSVTIINCDDAIQPIKPQMNNDDDNNENNNNNNDIDEMRCI